jgi:hypothetical protein
MAKQFTMSLYHNKEDLYKAKAEYLEDMFKALCNMYFMDTQQITIDLNSEELERIFDTLENSDYLD